MEEMMQEKNGSENEQRALPGKHDVFISYSSQNKNVADAIVADLEQHGIRCWYAPRGIMPGQEWASAIREALDEAKVFILIYTEESNQSRQVMNEVAMAFKGGKVIVPFRLTEDLMNSELEYYLTRVHWLDALTEPLSESIKMLRKQTGRILECAEEDGFCRSGEQTGIKSSEPATEKAVMEKKSSETAPEKAVIEELSGESNRQVGGSREQRQGNLSQRIIACAAVVVAVCALIAVVWIVTGAFGKDRDPEEGKTSEQMEGAGEERENEAQQAGTKPAGLGNADDMKETGDRYMSGADGTSDPEQALDWYTRAAEAGSTEAIYAIGMLYSGDGLGAADFVTAAEWFRKGGDAGDVLCLRALAGLYAENLINGEDNWNTAMSLYEQAAEKGDAYSSKALGCMLYADGYLQTSCTRWQEAVEGGDTEALIYLGRAYYRGEGVTKDEKQAFSCFLQAAETGETFAMYLLACCYANGIGTIVDSDLSRQWYETARECVYEPENVFPELLRIMEKDRLSDEDMLHWLQG